MVYGYPTAGPAFDHQGYRLAHRVSRRTATRFPAFASRSMPPSIPATAADRPSRERRMIGLAFSRLSGGTENIGYIIPCEEIELFLKDVADGHYDGKPGYTTNSKPSRTRRAGSLKLPNPCTPRGRQPYSEDSAYAAEGRGMFITRNSATHRSTTRHGQPGRQPPSPVCLSAQKIADAVRVP